MLFPKSFPVNEGDLLFIEFAPVVLPAFTTRKARHANHDLLARHGIDEVEVTPVLYERQSESWYDDSTRSGGPVHEILFFFDPDEFPVADYGIVFTDPTFEAAAAKHMRGLFPAERFGEIEYTELANQCDDAISMEFPIADGRGFGRAIRKDPVFFEHLVESPMIRSSRLISAVTADLYAQAVSPHADDSKRPRPPEGLYAGMWVTWGAPTRH
ncbi:hypothetical protein [Defluviimonas salinarum]|uniref:Uncharacterized protein n=1 Tax=Defluviimonas salinarum TaxID=2992147 RepID=A0ABT3J491_9RHOB|nr:hypothetical protein [Defluviimonas salinarum]MCW3782486.1 hypothetical protein [Defluviimonas salinarum]